MKFLLSIGLTMMLYVMAPLKADNVTVTVACNGQPVQGLPIAVYDKDLQQIPGISVTNNKGTFLISNSEDYPVPYSLFFRSSQGSTCGAYNIIINGENVGFVNLDYYPTNVPCSCSKLIQ